MIRTSPARTCSSPKNNNNTACWSSKTAQSMTACWNGGRGGLRRKPELHVSNSSNSSKTNFIIGNFGNNWHETRVPLCRTFCGSRYGVPVRKPHVPIWASARITPAVVV